MYHIWRDKSRTPADLALFLKHLLVDFFHSLALHLLFRSKSAFQGDQQVVDLRSSRLFIARPTKRSLARCLCCVDFFSSQVCLGWDRTGWGSPPPPPPPPVFSSAVETC